MNVSTAIVMKRAWDICGDIDILGYLEQWRSEDCSSYNLCLDRELIIQAADFIDGSGALEEDNGPEAAVCRYLAALYNGMPVDVREALDAEGVFIDVDVYTNDKTGETAFITSSADRECLNDGFKLDTAYDNNGLRSTTPNY